ncbi:MAG: class I tRNA ligase family protein [Anaerolineae bacterium]|nr:class I tRNA ligase family protein [Anaerolineae bacterium]
MQVIEPGQVPPGFQGVYGEIVRRTENILQVQNGNAQVTVEVLPEAQIIIPEVPGTARVDQLRQHLEIQRMSKSRGNVVNPDELVQQYGADTVRAYLMFAFDWMKGGPWDSQGIQGVVRWLRDVWEVVHTGAPISHGDVEAGSRQLLRKAHQAIAKVEDGMQRFSFNTAVAALMELKNALVKAQREGNVDAQSWHEAVRIMLLLMAPVTPFMAEELWAREGHSFSVHQQAFPTFDAALAAEDEITLGVQVNGKVRDRITVPATISAEDAKARALASEAVQRYLEGKTPRKVIYVPKNGLVNIVI